MKFYRDREGRIVTIIMPKAWIVPGPPPKRPLADWPSGPELAACIGVLLWAITVEPAAALVKWCRRHEPRRPFVS